jgi:hypothetical protein
MNERDKILVNKVKPSWGASIEDAPNKKDVGGGCKWTSTGCTSDGNSLGIE